MEIKIKHKKGSKADALKALTSHMDKADKPEGLSVKPTSGCDHDIHLKYKDMHMKIFVDDTHVTARGKLRGFLSGMIKNRIEKEFNSALGLA